MNLPLFLKPTSTSTFLGQVSRPGGFNDLDALEVGVPGRQIEIGAGNATQVSFCPGPQERGRRKCKYTGVDKTMSDAAQRTHFALWSIAASPLILGLGRSLPSREAVVN